MDNMAIFILKKDFYGIYNKQISKTDRIQGIQRHNIAIKRCQAILDRINKIVK